MIVIKSNKLLKTIKKHLPKNPIIVEAGSFDGRHTIILSNTFPKGTVHAFEPVPEIFTLLEKNTQQLSNVIRYQQALSNCNGTAQFYVSELPDRPNKPFQAGSLMKPKERLHWSPAEYKKTISVLTTTLDFWEKKNNIDHVDLLWLDLQGHEYTVMHAAPIILKTVSVIVTEVGFIEAYENQPHYKKVKAWLEKQEFTAIAKDFKDETSWFFGNVLFIRL
jgi:FkbM family methyltransferase